MCILLRAEYEQPPFRADGAALGHGCSSNERSGGGAESGVAHKEPADNFPQWAHCVWVRHYFPWRNLQSGWCLANHPNPDMNRVGRSLTKPAEEASGQRCVAARRLQLKWYTAQGRRRRQPHPVVRNTSGRCSQKHCTPIVPTGTAAATGSSFVPRVFTKGKHRGAGPSEQT